MKRFILFPLILFSFLGCSKEEIPDNPIDPEVPSQTVIRKGVFLDSPVEGLIYRTLTQEGMTNSRGEFKYIEGEVVNFSIGSVNIGAAEGKAVLTPIDIASTPNATINSLEVKNIAAFLQTFDADKNPENGIEISTQAVAALPEDPINFNEHFVQLLGEIVAEINKNTLMDLQVVFPEVAASHLAETLDLNYEISGLEAGPFFDIVEKWDTRTRNVNWIHKFDSQGRISESMAFEKFPWRPILKYVYSSYNSNGYPQYFDGYYLNENGASLWSLNWYLQYGQNSNVKTYSWSPQTNADPGFYVYDIITIDEERRVTEYNTTAEGTMVLTTSILYDDQNNSFKLTNFDPRLNRAHSGNEYYFTDFGSLSLWNSFSGNGRLTGVTNRSYRENYTLEKLEIINYQASGEVLKTIYYIDGNGGTYRTEKYSNGFLFELYERNVDRSSKTTIYNREEGSYYIEFRDLNNQIYKTEYYDSDGNLYNTEVSS